MTEATEAFSFRASRGLLAEVDADAARLGMSRSEYVRHALRRECNVLPRVSLPPVSSATDGALRDRAAFGDHAALRELASRMVNRLGLMAQVVVDPDDDVQAAITYAARRELLTAALIFTGMAAAHGFVSDRELQGHLLHQRQREARAEGDVGYADELSANGIAILADAADRGSDQAAGDLLDVCRETSAAAVHAAGTILKKMATEEAR